MVDNINNERMYIRINEVSAKIRCNDCKDLDFDVINISEFGMMVSCRKGMKNSTIEDLKSKEQFDFELFDLTSKGQRKGTGKIVHVFSDSTENTNSEIVRLGLEVKF